MAYVVWILAISLAPAAGIAYAVSKVPAMFVFGDSLSDPGNNNNLNTLAKGNFYPNGIDFPAGVTGRFCNGGTISDHLGNMIGLPLIPPFSDPSTKGSKILQGVNYASGAAGILNDTGTLAGDRFSMDEQLQNFQKTVEELRSELRSINGGGIGDFLGKSLFFVCIGSNDYINNYLFPLSPKPLEYTIRAFHELVLQQFTRQLKSVYELGGRKFLVIGFGPLGCIPNQIATLSKNLSACVESTNEISSQYNAKLKSAIKELNRHLTGAYFLYWDVFTLALEVIRNPTRYGFQYAHEACCGVGRSKGKVTCLPFLPLECNNRSQFLFWDSYHPTDAFNRILARQAYQGKLQSTYPMNVQQLLQL